MSHSILLEVNILIMTVSIWNDSSILVPQTVPLSAVPRVERNCVLFQVLVNV